MELLYKTNIPLGRVHCISWSPLNLIAASVSVQMEGFVAKNFEGASTRQLLVFDPNRPWDFHTIASDYKSVVLSMSWSMDGTRLLALSQDGTIRVWRMKTNCVNSWVCANKVEAGAEGDVVHVGWLDYRPMVTIHHSKCEWPEVMEVQPFSPHLRMLLGSGFISVSSSGLVRVDSTSVAHVAEDGELYATVQLPSRGNITIARTHVTQTGTILCCVGYESGQVKVFSVSVGLCWGSEFILTASVATELHQMSSQSEKITNMLMLPLSDGCEVHLCYNSNQLYKWSVKDITRSGSYQSRREGSYTSAHPLYNLVGSALCLGSHDPTVTENKMSELLVFGDDDVMKEREGWPVEVVGCGAVGGMVSLFSRGSCKLLVSQKGAWQEPEDLELPAAKRRKLDQSVSSNSCLVTISPNACCIAVAQENNVLVYHIGKLILGMNEDSSTPMVPRCSRLLSLSLVSGHTPWDLAVTCSCLEHGQGSGFVDQVLQHFSEDFHSNSSTLSSRLLQQFYSTCSMLQCSKEDGLLPALSYRRMSRLNATVSLLMLSLPTDRDHEYGLVERLTEVCAENSTEGKIEEMVGNLETKDFDIPQDVSSHLQGHCHWLVELAIKVVGILASGKEDSKLTIPDDPSLKLLRQCLVLVYLWNKSLSQSILPVTDGALSLLFKALTSYLQSPSTPFSEELLTELSTNIPSDVYSNTLSLSKAAQLQGFISGLSSAQLPESFIKGKPCRIRPSVQSNYSSPDPYSPLTLVVPKGLSPPWRDCFLEGQKDIVYGGGLTKAVVQNTKLKQCSSTCVVTEVTSLPSYPSGVVVGLCPQRAYKVTRPLAPHTLSSNGEVHGLPLVSVGHLGHYMLTQELDNH